MTGLLLTYRTVVEPIYSDEKTKNTALRCGFCTPLACIIHCCVAYNCCVVFCRAVLYFAAVLVILK